MKVIELKNASVTYPIFGASERSLRSRILSEVGGKLIKKQNQIAVQALKNINLEINSGERIGLVGHNGSGKSTLLKLIAGCIPTTSGSINVKGKISSLLNLGMGLFPELTGYENILCKSGILGLEKNIKEEFIKDVIEFSELDNFLNLPVKTYSAGMQLRLAFTMATSSVAEILIIDEIFNVGDSYFLKKSETRMKNILNKAKVLLLASHNPDLLKKFCNRLVHFNKGEISLIENN